MRIEGIGLFRAYDAGKELSRTHEAYSRISSDVTPDCPDRRSLVVEYGGVTKVTDAVNETILRPSMLL